MPAPGEHKTVQARILKYAQETVWKFVPRAEAEARRGFDPDGATPEESERREIVTALDAVTRTIPVQQTKRRLLEALFRTLLHQLMTAQIRVNDLSLDGL